MLTELSLCSGIGGFSLAWEWAGGNTIGFVEKDNFCRDILRKHWPEAHQHETVETFTINTLAGWGYTPDDITLITAGFPCQPYSLAGQRLGNQDDRAIWPQIYRIITEVQPRWVCLENVPGLITMALDGVLSDLEKAGYETGTLLLPACAKGAWHIRERLFIVAHSNRAERRPPTEGRDVTNRDNTEREKAASGSGLRSKSNRAGLVAHSESTQQLDLCGEQRDIQQSNNWTQGQSGHFSQGGNDATNAASHELTRAGIARGRWSELADGSGWQTQPGVGVLADGLPGRVARLKALGNALSPEQAYCVLRPIADYELSQQ